MTQAISATPTLAGERGLGDAAALPRPRLDSIDLLRGLVMVLMALDHVKMLFSVDMASTDLTRTTPAYFLTRWITHFCAPVFVFLAGTGAFLAGSRGQTRGQLAWFLFSRGLWLIFLEFTVVRFAWTLNLNYLHSMAQVIWAIGCSMVALSGLVFLPTWFVAAFGVAMIATHNAWDGLRSEQWGRLAWLWRFLHEGGSVGWAPGRSIFAAYPLVPWIGVLAAGYGFGEFMREPPPRRRRIVLALGMALTLAFIALRYTNLYGDHPPSAVGKPGPWSVQKNWMFTIFSFLNCQKYPPSLCFLLMTLGPALVALALFDRPAGPVGRFFILFGRVPLFFYLLHFYVIKGLAIAFAFGRYGRAGWFFGIGKPPDDYGYNLWIVYLLWLAVVALMFPLCRWYAGVKRRSRAAWLSYL